jgi:hypothetical protein
MNFQSDYRIEGVVQGCQYGQNERVDELNNRMSNRQFPDAPLEPNFTPRATPTKYSLFPIVNLRKPATEPIYQQEPYNQYNNFNPGTARAPPSGFLNNIDTETVLRNQTFALQKGAGQNAYVPTLNSELYNVKVVSQPGEQTHPLLFSRPDFTNRVHPNLEQNNIGRDNFFNHTRTQLRNT